MANRKKSRSQRKKPMSFSIKTATSEEFIDLCIINKLIASHEVEVMIENRIKELNTKYKD